MTKTDAVKHCSIDFQLLKLRLILTRSWQVRLTQSTTILTLSIFYIGPKNRVWLSLEVLNTWQKPALILHDFSNVPCVTTSALHASINRQNFCSLTICCQTGCCNIIAQRDGIPKSHQLRNRLEFWGLWRLVGKISATWFKWHIDCLCVPYSCWLIK
jgi:hypothetical protein